MTTITLANCADEPIHVPGAIQRHGVLLAFARDRRLVAASGNAADMLGAEPRIGAPIEALGAIAPLVPESLWEFPDVAIPDRHFAAIDTPAGNASLVAHAWRDRVVVEIEPRDASEPAVAAGRVYQAVRTAASVEAVLQRAVDAIRAVAGYDRVMGYTFHPDDSGEVVAEARSVELPAFIGWRYPASDIPAQARRLYLLNAVRCVVDVRAEPVPLLTAANEPPIDLSFADLRAISPIHIEYLRNMGVGASMSLSLIVDGRLFGLIACHHREPRRPSLDLRVACEGFAHTVSARLQAVVSEARARRIADGAAKQAKLSDDLAELDELLPAVQRNLEPLRETLRADALLVVHGATVLHTDAIDAGSAATVARLVRGAADRALERGDISQWPDEARGAIDPWFGLLARRFDSKLEGWLVALRREDVAQVSWGGDPYKPVEIGPNGPRLTPRGSFELWVETVRGRAPPWRPVTREIADGIASRLEHFVLHQRLQLEQLRAHVIAMLGHDLRNPLQTITTAAWIMERQDASQPLAGQIRDSSGRMARLIGQSLDFTRLTNGLALSVEPVEVDFAALARRIAEEFRVAYPDVVVAVDGPDSRTVRVDADRFAQVVSNLLSNARHHGTPGHPIRIVVGSDASAPLLEVRNVGAPIPDDTAHNLYTPFKRSSLAVERNSSGLGIGLYIVAEILKEHRGTIRYRHEAPDVVFEVRLSGGGDA